MRRPAVAEGPGRLRWRTARCTSATPVLGAAVPCCNRNPSIGRVADSPALGCGRFARHYPRPPWNHRSHPDDAPPDPGGVQRADAGAVPRRSRPDHRRHRPAHHRRRPGRPRPSVVGGDGLHAHLDGERTALRQDLRPLRPQDRVPGVHRHLPHRLGAGGYLAVDGATHRLPGDPGPRCRRSDRDGDDHCRRGPLAARAGPLSGLHRLGVRPVVDRRTAVGRVSSSTTSAGAGCSTSTCRSGSSPWW